MAEDVERSLSLLVDYLKGKNDIAGMALLKVFLKCLRANISTTFDDRTDPQMPKEG